MPPSTPVGFFEGLGYPLRGARFVYSEHPRLAWLWVPAIVLTTLTFVAMVWLTLEHYKDLTTLLWSEPLTGTGWRLLHRFFGWIVAAVLLVLGTLLVSLVASMIAAPFSDALSNAVERLATGKTTPDGGVLVLLHDAVRSVAQQFVKVTLYWLLVGPLLLVSWIVPVAGPPLYAIGAFGAASFFLALDYVDWPASRHGFSIRDRLSLARRNLRAFLGMGTGVWITLFIPVLGFCFMPAAVAGGTLLFLELEARGLTRREQGR